MLQLKMLFLLAALFVSQVCYGFVKYDPKFVWKTIETPHFLIHYQDGLESMAQELAAYGESMQSDVSAYFNWLPLAKTHLVLSDQQDTPNGFAIVRPYNRIEIFSTPPSSINSLEDFDNWKQLVFKHEYVHVVQMDKASDFPLHLRDLLGRWGFLFPGQFMPAWIKEGIATHLETDEALGVGRGQSSYFRGVMRNELLNGLKPLGMVNHIPLDWPNGMTSYLYGVYFFNFLKERYGDSAVQEFFELYTSIPVPFFLNYSAKRTIGFNFDTLWTQFEEYLHQKFDTEVAQVKTMPDDSKQIITTGYQSGFSRPGDNGNIFFIANDLETKVSINELDPETGLVTSLFTLPVQTVSTISSFDYHPKKGLVIPISDMQVNSRQPTDLYLLPTGGKQLNRLTHDARYIRAAWSADGTSLAAVQVNKGQHKLVQLNLLGEQVKILYESEPDVLIGPLDWSPVDNKIIASVFRPGYGWNMEIFDIATGIWKKLTNNHFIESDPQFNANGNKILYSAEYNGIYNIYEYDMETGIIQQISNSLTIAYQPVYSLNEDRIYYSQLDKDGFNLHSLSNTYLKSVYISHVPETPAVNNEIPHSEALPSGEYKGFNYLKPVWWLPTIVVSEQRTSVGFITDANDPLYWHNYYLQLDYDFKNDNPGWLAYYRYKRLYPDLLIASQRQSLYQNNRPVKNTNQVIFQAELPWIKNSYRLSTIANYQFSHIEREFATTSHEDQEYVTASLSLDTRSIRNRAFLPYDGLIATASFENENLVDDPERNSRVSLRGKYVSPLLGYTIFDLEATAVLAGGLATPLTLGGHFRESDNNIGFVRHDYNLKGYETNTFTGSSLQRLHFSWNLFAAKPQHNFMIPPIGFSRVFFKTYIMAARIGSFDSVNSAPWFRSIGTEIQINSDFGYKLWPFAIIAGIAKGIDAKGGLFPYFEVALQF